MFNLSGSEIIFLILIALVVLGPDKLPDAMRKAGKAYGDFKRMTSGFQSEMKSVLDEPMRELRETADLAKKSAMFDTSSITKPQSGTMAPVPPATTPPATAPPASTTPAPTTPEPTPPASTAPASAAPSSAPPLDVALDATSRRLARIARATESEHNGAAHSASAGTPAEEASVE